jgi:hypothetical protein
MPMQIPSNNKMEQLEHNLHKTHIISDLLTKKEKKEREKSVLLCLYDSAINIHVFMLGN